MKYELSNGKVVNIPDDDIKGYMKSLDLTKDEAIAMWLDDEGYTENNEQMELEQKAKDSGVMRDIHGASAMDKTKSKSAKPKVVKVSDEKQTLFAEILSNLEYDYEKVEVLKQNKLIQVEINGKIFKIDLIEQRPKKK